jgi:hypothetical protein
VGVYIVLPVRLGDSAPIPNSDFPGDSPTPDTGVRSAEQVLITWQTNPVDPKSMTDLWPPAADVVTNLEMPAPPARPTSPSSSPVLLQSTRRRDRADLRADWEGLVGGFLSGVAWLSVGQWSIRIGTRCPHRSRIRSTCLGPARFARR